MKEKKNEFDYVIHNMKDSIGGGQSSSMYIQITPFRKEETIQVVVTLEVLKRYKIEDIEMASKLYEQIQRFHFELDKIVNGK